LAQREDAATEEITMNATDIAVLILGIILGAGQSYASYRVGVWVGTMRERERREGLEARIRQQIETAAKRDAALWETEIDA
jgi:hypothetical protein